MKKLYLLIAIIILFSASAQAQDFTLTYEMMQLNDIVGTENNSDSDIIDTSYGWTGKEYLKSVRRERDNDNNHYELYTSYDRQNWEKLELSNEITNFLHHCLYRIQWYGDRYIVPADEAGTYTYIQKAFPFSHYVLDSNFNIIAETTTVMEHVPYIRYYNGIYYMGRKTSTDFINWESFDYFPFSPLSYNNNFVIGTGDAGHCVYMGGQSVEIKYERKNPRDSYAVYPEKNTGFGFYWYTADSKILLSVDGIYWVECETSQQFELFPESNSQTKLYVDSSNFYVEYTDHKLKFNISEALDYLNNLQTIYVKLNDRILGFAEPPVIEEDRTLVPMRFLFEQMGESVEWNNDTQTATVKKSANESISFSINDTTAKIGNTTATMDVPARLINNRTMVPLRFLSENLGYNVEWNQETNTAVITQ